LLISTFMSVIIAFAAVVLVSSKLPPARIYFDSFTVSFRRRKHGCYLHIAQEFPIHVYYTFP
jgi:hypothetical protein